MNPGLDLSAALAVEHDVDIEVRGYVPIRLRRADPFHPSGFRQNSPRPQQAWSGPSQRLVTSVDAADPIPAHARTAPGEPDPEHAALDLRQWDRAPVARVV